MCNSPLVKNNYSSAAGRAAKDSVEAAVAGLEATDDSTDTRHNDTAKQPEQDTREEPFSAQVAVKAEKRLKKSVKWAGELVETLLYHPLQRCEEMATDNTLIIKDLPTIVLNGSLSRNAPRWTLGSLLNATNTDMATETGIRLVESSVVCHSQLFGLVQIPNLAFEKQVSLIYTTNDWKQVLTLPLVYHSSSADGKTDLFQFHIDLQSLSPLSVVLRFCFKYTYGGVGPDAITIYENNYQRNFSMVLSVSLPPHKNANNNYVSPIKKRSKPRIPQSSSRRMVSLTLQDSCGSFLLVPPPKSMMSTYSLSYSYS